METKDLEQSNCFLALIIEREMLFFGRPRLANGKLSFLDFFFFDIFYFFEFFF